jgi:hypothetical protein
MNLFGEILAQSELRFDYSSTYAVALNPRQGLKRFGPYDSNQFDKLKIRCGVIYPKKLADIKTVLIDGLTKGSGSFVGFHKLFRVPLAFEEEQSISTEDVKEIKTASGVLAGRELDLVFILTSTRNIPLYQTCKSEFLGNGVPSQVIISEKLRDPRQCPWILENIALASYAKVGGTPWVVANPTHKNQLVLGISRAQDHNKQFLVGFVTLFIQNGDFLLMHSKAPVIDWDKYVEGLTTLICEAVEEYGRLRGVPESIIIHLHKQPGYRELEAIENAIRELQENVPYALLHLNEYSNFRLFDTSHSGYIPESGLKVNLSLHQALLLFDGRIGNQRRKIGVPRVLDIVMDKRSNLAASEFPSLVRQIYAFARVNWRGFNAAAIPVTLNYSKLIARMVVEVGANRWNEIIASGKLRDKAWFL